MQQQNLNSQPIQSKPIDIWSSQLVLESVEIHVCFAHYSDNRGGQHSNEPISERNKRRNLFVYS